MDRPTTVLCLYRVIPGREEELVALMRSHDRTLRELSLVTDTPTRVYRGSDGQDRPFFVKIFEWKSEDAVARAHQHPEVAGTWERMEPLCESRNGRPPMEFPHVEPVEI